jgi:two-component system, OmpR family, phosphate regulon sensor histidine kinase PhoR
MHAGQPRKPGILRSRFLWRLFGGYAAVLLVTGVFATWLAQHRLEASLLANLRASLEDQCLIFEPYAARVLRVGDPGLAGELARLREVAEVRVTLIGADGRVLGDSHEDPAGMDDHASRPEIVQARREAFGTARRTSRTIGIEMLYVAHRLGTAEQPLGYVRMALSTQQVQHDLGTVERSVALGTAAGVALALVLGLFLARHVTLPIAEIRRVAVDLSAGRYESRARVERADELGVLAETLNGLGAEITRRIAALSQEDAQLRAILASMIEGVVAVDEEDRVAFINSAALALLEVAGPVQPGRSLWELAPIRELEELLAQARRSEGYEVREIELHRSGKERLFEAHASPFRGGGRSGFVLVLHDITELRRLERVRRDFVANVSHELKTPLTSIQGFVETLLSGALSDERHNVQFLQRIDANVKRLTNLVTDLLSLARIESGQLDVQRGELDWREILDAVLRLREPALAAKGLALAVEGRERPLRVRGDREALTQVLDNLLDNAIQYTNPGGRVTLRLASHASQGALEVEDTGMGIPSADLDRIFERFYRVDKARSRVAGGTGLGLSIVKNLVLRMEGTVEVESVEGRGSTFRVRLPLA